MQDASKLSSPSSSPPPSPFFPAVSTALEDRHSISMRPGKINILPRTTGRYSPLDNAGTTGSRKFGWKGVALVLGIFVGAVWFINPQQQLQQYTSPHVEDVGMPYEDLDFSNTVPTNQPHPPFVPTKGDSKGGAIADEEDEDAAAASDHPPTLAQSPKSPEDDPDPLKTVHCLAPYKPNLPLVQYALMIDAGSTGSRIHIYKFHNCHASPTLEYEVFKMTIPGLSSYASDPDAAAKSLDVLMQEAVKVVPEKVQGCTKVAVKATAGLRLLGKDVSDAILAAVKQRITSEYKFPLAGKDAVTIMDGKDEGVYAWITANYLLGAIGGGAKGTRPTYAVLDLGGASTQIVFEPTFSQTGDGGSTTTTTALEEGDHKYILSFTGKKHTLYQHSYLGYGLMRARRSVHNLVAFMWDFRLDGKGGHDAPESADPVVPNPCLAKGTTRRISLDGGKWHEGYNVTMAGEDVGGFEHCNRIVELVMAKDALCKVKPCSFNGVYQPNILDTFPSGGILALSYFYDRIFQLLPAQGSPHPVSGRAWGWSGKPNGNGNGNAKSVKSTSSEPSSLPISDVALLADRVCEGPESWKEHWGPSSPFAQSFSAKGSTKTPEEASKEILAELDDRPEYCLDLTFMHALLRLGYEFGSERNVRVEKKVDGVELGWCLGAVIAMLLEEGGEGVQCVA